MAGSTPLEFDALYRRLDEAERKLTREPSPEEREAVLAARARALATSRTVPHVEAMPVVVIRVGGERYAVKVAEVEQVLPSAGLASLAGAPRHVLGALVAQSRILPVLDLRQLLGLAERNASDLTAVLVVRAGEDRFGLAAEEVEGRRELPLTELRAATSGPFQALAPGLLAVLDLERLLGGDRPDGAGAEG